MALAKLEAVRSPRCQLAELRRRLVQPTGSWRRGEDWWTAEEAVDELVPADAGAGVRLPR